MTADGPAFTSLAQGAGAVTVSMPYWRCQDTVRRAVDAVLAQTYTDLILYVVNDGDDETPPWDELADITDPRLIRVDLPVNRGRYFADAAVLASATTPWFAVHDADDWAEPFWLDHLVFAAAVGDLVAAFGYQAVHRPNRATTIEQVSLPFEAGPGNMRHLAHHAGVYRTTVAQRLGGHPGYRIGFDTLMVNMMAMLGPIGAVAQVLYHRTVREGSLTTDPSTRLGSRTRQQVRKALNRLYVQAMTDGDPVAVLHADVDPDLRAAVASAAAGITAGHYPPPERPPVSVLSEPVWGGWALDRHTAHELAAYLHTTQPRVVVESGSGMSTVILAEYAARIGAQVVSLEHQPRYAEDTEQALRERGLSQYADVRLSHLVDVATPAGARPWYSAPVPEGIDFALIDGPPAAVKRTAALYALWPHLADQWTAWVDDADRDGERRAVALWESTLGVHVTYVGLPKGLIRLTPAGQPPPEEVDASDVTVTLLTGSRPDLLAATIQSVLTHAPGLLESAHVAVLHNGADTPTADVLDQWSFIDTRVPVEPRLDIGAAASALLGNTAGRPYSLHLEDDWGLSTLAPGWLDRARTVLSTDAQVGQVRLRHRGDPVLATHMVTHRSIRWREHHVPGHLVGLAHYTLNPSLMRSGDTPKVWPADDEQGAARRFLATRLLTAQAVPGVFRHLGDRASLRRGQR